MSPASPLRRPSALRGALPVLVAALGLLVYLGMLHHRTADRDHDVVVLYTGRTAQRAPVDSRTRLPLWATEQQVDREVARFFEDRAERDRPTYRLRARGAVSPGLQVEPVGERMLALIEVPDTEEGRSFLQELPPSVAEADLRVVATDLPPATVRAVLEAPHVLLPGTFHPGVPGEVEVQGGEELVAPWVDSRYRVGVLGVDFPEGGGVACTARAVELPTGDPAPQGSTLVGIGDPALFHDTIHFQQAGLGMAVARSMLRRTGADVALLNYLSIREGLVGRVDAERLQAAFPFHNQVETLTLAGEHIAALLEENRHEDTRYLLVAGLHLEEGRWVDPQGRPLQQQRSYRVATVDYLANGGRGRRPRFLEGKDRLRTGLYTDRLAVDLLRPPEED